MNDIWYGFLSGVDPVAFDIVLPTKLPQSKSCSVGFWPETKYDGMAIYYQLEDEAPCTLSKVKKKRFIHTPLIKAHDVILGFIGGHQRKPESRDEYLEIFILTARQNPSKLFGLVYSERSQTEKNHQCDPTTFKILPTLPRNCFLYTCKEAELSKVQLQVLTWQMLTGSLFDDLTQIKTLG